MNRRDSLPARQNSGSDDFSYTLSAVSIDNPRAWVSDLVVISPVVSTPGARPPQGGLCYFRMPPQRPSHALNHETGFPKQLYAGGQNLSQFPSPFTDESDTFQRPATW